MLNLKKNFENSLAEQPQNANQIPLSFILNLLIDSYLILPKKHHVVDQDMLLFEYGNFDWWDEEGERFELSFSRQIALDKLDGFEKISITLYYQSRFFGDIEAFDLWSIEFESLEKWKDTVQHSEGFIRASQNQISNFLIELYNG